MFRADHQEFHISCAGDSILVIRDAMLSLLQKIDCAFALRSADAGQENAAPDECNVQESNEVSNLP